MHRDISELLEAPILFAALSRKAFALVEEGFQVLFHYRFSKPTHILLLGGRFEPKCKQLPARDTQANLFPTM